MTAYHGMASVRSRGWRALRSGLVVSVLGLCLAPGPRAQVILVPPAFRLQRCRVSATIRVLHGGPGGSGLTAGEVLAPDGAVLTRDTRGEPAATVVRCTAEVGEEWEELAFTFSSAQDVATVLELRGGALLPFDGAPVEHPRQQYAIVDDVALTSAEVEVELNGGFENGAPLPMGWRGRGLAAFGENAAEARSGRRYAVVSADHPAERRLSLCAGWIYILRVWFRASRGGCSRPANKPPASTVNVFVVPVSSGEFALRPGRVLAGPGGVTKIRRGVDKEECLNFRSAVGLAWQELAFGFSAEHDATVSLELGGQWWPPRPGAPWEEWVQRYVFVDDVSVSCDGEPVRMNGGFEGGGGGASAWNLGGQAAVATDPVEAHSGAASAVVSYHHRAATRFSVEAGKTYEVRLWYRAKPDGLLPWGRVEASAGPQPE